MTEDRRYLEFILDGISWIEALLASTGRDAFFDSRIVRDATLRNLHTVAEATLKLSDSLREEHPEVAWRQIGGFRNQLVHNVLSLDLALVWDVIHDFLPLLKRQTQSILEHIA